MQQHVYDAVYSDPFNRVFTVYDVIGRCPPGRRPTTGQVRAALSYMVRTGKLQRGGYEHDNLSRIRQYRRA